jgi:predicted transcriptional regulator
MKRTTIFIDEAMERDLHALAQRKRAPVSALVREALRRYLAEEHRRQKFSLRFLAAGRSGRKDIAERHEQLLWRDLKPHDTLPVTKGRRKAS